MKKLLLLIFILSVKVVGQNCTDNIVGSSVIIQSEIMNDERKIQIFLPESYLASDKDYPVLYILDGQRYFLHAVSLQKSFIEFKQTPEFIVVGISKNPSDRNKNFSLNSNQYLNFIENEIISYVDDKYRTSGKRMLFGWAFGGGFVIETMLSKSQLFDAYIAASPFPLKAKINRIDSLFTKYPDFDKLLFFSSETSDGLVKEGTNALKIRLTNKGYQSMNWTFKELEAEEHRSTAFTTLYHGLRKYFYYFPELQFNSLEEFSKAGGIAYVYEYYKKRALKYGFSKELSDWTMFSITRNAIRADNFKEFNTLINEFGKTNFIERLRVSRASSIAEFYLQNKQFDKALALFNLLSGKHPNSERPLNGLGDTYKAMNETKKASFYYKKAAELLERKSN